VLVASVLLAVPPALAGEDPPARPAPPREPPPPLVQTIPPPLGHGRAALDSGYVDALRALAGGDRERAIAVVIALESGDATAEVSTKEAARIERAGKELAARMAEVDGESLVPVMVFRSELMREYSRRRQPLLSLVSGNLALSSAGLYAEVRPETSARRLAGSLMASVGGLLQSEGSLQTARQLFEQALLFAPESAPALLGLGAHFELLGRYDLAAAHYSRLHGALPDDLEGALRLGVNLVRLKRYDHAVPVLERCVGADAPDWIAVLAAEELARALVGKGELSRARHVLEGGIERVPAEASLRVMLAFVLDRGRDPVAARAAVAAMGPGDPTAGPSARLRYCRWPRQALDAVRAELEQAARERESVLAAVVSALAARGA